MKIGFEATGTPRMHPMPRPRARRANALGLLFLAGLVTLGCNTGATPGALPAPDFQVPLGTAFPLRAGDLGYVQGLNDYLYISVQSLGADNRCPAESACDEPGFLEVFLELETSESQGAVRLQVPPSGEAVATFQGFEIRILGAAPAGRATRILSTEYILLVTVSVR